MSWISDLAEMLQKVPAATLYAPKLQELASEHEVLKAENEDLQAKLLHVQKEVQRLQKQIDNFHKASPVPKVVTKRPR